MYTLEDLPVGAEKLIEGIEIVGTVTALSGKLAYSITKRNGKWYVEIGSRILALAIPENISSYTPATMKIDEMQLNRMFDLKEFETEIKEINIAIIKKRNLRVTGYVGEYQHTSDDPHWELLFLDQSKFVDFYLICEKYNLI